MKEFSKTIIHPFYDFIEMNITKDYQYVIQTIEPLIDISCNMVLLDIGGGTGHLLEVFSAKVKQSLLMDPSRKMLNHSQSNDVLKIQADGVNMPLKDNSIDKVFLIHVLHHINKKYHEIVFKEIYRVLNSGGCFYVLDLYFPLTFWNAIFTKIEKFVFGNIFHVSSESVIKMVKHVGFCHIDCRHTDEKQWRFLIYGEKS